MAGKDYSPKSDGSNFLKKLLFASKLWIPNFPKAQQSCFLKCVNFQLESFKCVKILEATVLSGKEVVLAKDMTLKNKRL